MNHLNIETSQHVQIDYAPANIGSRVGAFILDAIILGIYIIGSITVITSLIGIEGSWAIFVFSIIPVMLYHLIMEVLFEGQSLGKKALEIKVIKTDGTPVTFGSYLLRWIFRLVEITASSGIIAFFSILINGKGQRLGDMAAGTTVVKTKKKTNLSDTLYTDIEAGYEPRYPEVKHLNDDDISTVKEVLNAGKKYDHQTYANMLFKTRDVIQNKMGTNAADDSDTVTFLRTVVKDYNFVHG